MAILGDAWIVLRAVTTRLNRDIQDGLDEAGDQADRSGDRAGKGWTSKFGDAVRDGLRDSSSWFDELDKNGKSRGNRIGATLVKGIGGGLQAGLSGLMSLAGMAAMVTGLVGAIGALVGALGALAAGAVAVTAALGPAMAAIGVVGVASIGALVGVMAVGMGIFKQLSSKTAELGENGLAVKESFKGLKAQFTDLFTTVGENKVFGPLNDLIKTLGDEMFPSLTKAVEGFGGVIGNVITRLNALFENPAFRGAFDNAIGGMVNLADSFGSVFVDLISVFVNLLSAARPVIDMFADWFKSWGANLRTITEAGVETGKLGAFFRKAGEVAAQFFDIMGNVWDVLRDVMKAAAPLGGVLLDSFQRGSQALSNFTSSAQGAEKMFDFFRPGGQVHANMSAVWALIKELGQSLVELTRAEGVEKLASGITRVLPGVTEVIVAAIDAVGEFADAIADGFTSPAGVKGVEAIRDGVEKLGGAFAELGPAIGPLMQIIGDLGSNLADVLGPAFKDISDMLPKLVDPLDRIGAAMGGVLGAAIEALTELIPPLIEIIASLAEGMSGPLALAIGATAQIISPLLTLFADLLGVMEPILPLLTTLVGAFLALRAAAAIGATLSAMGGFMMFAGQAGGVMAAGIGAAGGALRILGAALPGIAAGLFAFSSMVKSNDKDLEKWVESLGRGGAEAAKAQREMANPSVWQTVRMNMLHMFEDGTAAEKIQREVNQKLSDQIALMGPLEKAQFQLNRATEDYAYAVERGSAGSAAAREAKEQIAYWTEREQTASYNAARANEDYATAAQMVADSIWSKIDAELAASNATIQSEQSAIRMARAYEDMIAVQNDPNADPLKRRDAELAYQSALNTTTASLESTATAFAETAVKQGQFATNGEAMAFSLNEQAAKYEALAGTVEGPYRDALLEAARIAREQADQAFNIKLDPSGAIAGIQEFSNYMFSQPKSFDTEIKITGDDAASQAVTNINDKLATLSGFIPPIEIDAVTDEADAKIQDILGDLDDIDSSTPMASVQAQTSMARTQLREVLTDMLTVDGQKPTAEVLAYVDQAMVGLDSVMTGLLEANGAKATPQVLLDATAADQGLRYVDGKLVSLDNTTAVPGASLDPASFNAINSAVNGALTNTDGRTAVPGAALDPAQFNSISSGVNLALSVLGGRVVSPTVRATDAATPVITGIRRAIEGLQDRTVTITTRSKSIQEPGVQGMGRAAGGGRISTDSWTTVGEEGRELVFLSQGQYVATYHKARQILAAASMQASGAAAMAAGRSAVAIAPAVTGGREVMVPITVNPSAGMDELELARATGREFAFRYRRLP